MKRSKQPPVLKLLLLSAVILAACQAERGDDRRSAGDPVEFGASVCETGEIQTRALNPVYIESSPFSMDFYIQLCCEEADGQTTTDLGTYVVPSGFKGRLQSKDGEKPLSWLDLHSKHTFYAWNIPWDESYTPTDENIQKGIDIEFYDSAEGEEGYGQHKNNAVYEHFIGARSEMYSYKEHGKYVDLTFHHLVSKIKIGSFTLIEAGGAIQKDLKADITFVGMPTEATFYPHPTDDGRPRVEKKDADPDNGVTFFIANKASETEDIFYICPEVDFAKIDFKIKINNAQYKDYDTYYGTFADVKFRRESGTDYDSEEGNDSQILHAGEMMTLNIVLIPGLGPGLSLIIDKWNTDTPRESQYHPNPGFYTEADLNQFRSLFMDLRDVNDQETLDKLRELFNLYGVEEDGFLYFLLYENLDLSKNGDGNIFPIWKEYVLNGLGHTITLKTNSGNYWGHGFNDPYFNTGPVRDVYFTDPNGNNTIYIDEEGFVWVTVDGILTRTENQLQDLKTYEGGKWNSYDINARTGEIRYSAYFNGHITG